MPPLPPPAPSKRRAPPSARAAPSAPAASNRSAKTTADALANDLSALRISSAPAASSTRAPLRTMTAPSRTRPLVKSAVRPASSRSKEVEQEEVDDDHLPPTERAKVAKKVVNASLQTLSAAAKSGWKGSSRPDVAKAVKDGSAAIQVLRTLLAQEGSISLAIGVGYLEIEKGASAMVSSLVEMGCYSLAIPQLLAMRQSLLSLWTSPDAGSTAASLSFPLPPPTYLQSTLENALNSSALPAADLVPLVLTIQQYLLGCIFRSDPPLATLDHVVEGVSATGGPADWRALSRTFSDQLNETTQKRIDALMVSMFGSITKACVGADDRSSATVLLSLRTTALVYLSTTPLPPLKLASFYDQLRKVLLLYGRACEKVAVLPTDLSDAVVTAFERARRSLLNPQHDHPDVSKKWIELCEVVVHVARRASDFATVERISSMIDQPSEPSSTSTSETIPAVTATPNQIAAHCARLSAIYSAFESFTEKGVPLPAGCARQAQDLLRRLTVLRPRPDEEHESAQKIDRAIERLRSAVVKSLRAGRRLEQLLRVNDEGSVPDEDILGILEAVAVYVEDLRKQGISVTSLVTGAVDSLIVLAFSRLVLSDRATYSTAYTSLERAIILLSATFDGPASTLSSISFTSSTQHAVRAASTAYYNIGGTLFNDGRPEAAVRFLRRACELGDSVVTSASSENTCEIRNELRNMLGKRWEMLGLAHQTVGDRAAAHSAYVSALVYQPSLHFETLASDQSSTSARSVLFKLAQRCTRMATFDLLLSPAHISLRQQLTQVGRLPGEVGAVLEMQIEVLGASIEKLEAQEGVRVLLDELLGIYAADTFPLRRASILVRRMQYRCEQVNVAVDLFMEAAAAEIDDLCSRTTFGCDEHLRAFTQQYVAFSHLWLAFHAQAVQSTSATISVELEARSALRILRKALDPSLVASPSAPRVAASPKVTSPKAEAKAQTRERGAAKRPPPAGTAATTRRGAAQLSSSSYRTPKVSRTMRAPPVEDSITPPRQEVVNLDEAMHGLSLQERSVKVMDDIHRRFLELDMMAQLLGLLGLTNLRIAYLQFLRRLSSMLGSEGLEAFVVCSARLGEEYTRSGRTHRAGAVLAQALHRIELELKKGHPAAPTSRIEYFRAYAAYLATIGIHDRSAQAYSEALDLADVASEQESSASSTQRIAERSLVLCRASSASSTCSMMFQRQGKLSQSLDPALQAMRLAFRALNNIARLASDSAAAPVARADTLFDATGASDPKAPLADSAVITRKSPQASLVRGNYAGLAWRAAQDLITATLHVASLYVIRGTAKSAEHYAGQALNLAKESGSACLSARCLVIRCEVRLRSGRLDEAEADLSAIDALLGSVSCQEAIEAGRLRAELHLRRDEALEAHHRLVSVHEELDKLVSCITECDAGRSPTKTHRPPARSPVVHRVSFASPRSAVMDNVEIALPTLHSQILRSRTLLLRMQNRQAEADILLSRLAKLRLTEEDKADELRLLAAIGLEDMLRDFSSDPLLGMLHDSVLSVPTLSTSGLKNDSPRRSRSILNGLQEVEKLLHRACSIAGPRSEPAKLRELSLLSTASRLFQSSAGKSTKQAATNISMALDAGLAITLSREMLEAIDAKVGNRSPPNDLVWPSLDAGPVTAMEESRDRTTEYWLKVRDRHRLEAVDASLGDDRGIAHMLPAHWTVVSLHTTVDRDGVVLVRHQRDTEPVTFRLPFKRIAQRAEEDELTYDMVFTQLRRIIAESNAGTQRAKHVTGKEERVAWWQEREQLDQELRELVEGVEAAWLGAFKAVFLPCRRLSTDAIAVFRKAVESILRRGIVRSHDKKTVGFRLNDAVLACLAALKPTPQVPDGQIDQPQAVSDEDLEDLYVYIVESLQFSGVQVAYDEDDEDQMVCDLRTALEAVHAMPPNDATSPESADDDDHLFLVLDKDLQSFPWESIPCLQGKSISRVPSLAFLRDRMDLAATLSPANPSARAHNIEVDSSKTYFVLNPGGDLAKTQTVFEPWLKQMEKTSNWVGCIGRAPSEAELKSALSEKELVLYFGHGGAEQYIRSQTLRHLPRCAVTMLWGCSSGALKDQGDYDPVGTPYHYMIAGCPALVANLWDVTDKDIDLISQSVCSPIGLDSSRPTADGRRPTLAGALATARQSCNLKYLNGAAPVVFGIPVHFV